ncbi:fibronectin type III domain-containing protein [Rhodobacteraceae bacterium]|nr:fibronectin type III domain-containing protein [Paracoccaceae bacterium]
MMRKSLCAILLACTTSLTPVKAHADPISGMLAAAAAFAGSVGAGISGVLAATGIGFAAADAIVMFAGRTLLSLGLSAVAMALAPSPAVPKPSEMQGNFAQAQSYFTTGYGRARVGSVMGFTGTWRGADPQVPGDYDASKRFISYIVACHSTRGPVAHYLNDELVDVDPVLETVTTNPYGYDEDGNPAKPRTHVRLQAFMGHAGQAAPQMLLNAFAGKITPAHDFAGLSGVHAWYRKVKPKYNADIYPSGLPAYAPVWDLHDVIYDPRDGSTGWTNNAALVMAHWAGTHGLQVVWDDIAVQADIADRIVTDREGVQRRRWTLNGTLDDTQDFETQRAQLMAACDGFIYERADGCVGIEVGHYRAPEVTLTDADFLSLELAQGGYGSNTPTAVAASYVEPANVWRETTSAAYVVAGDQREVRDEPQVFFATNHNQALRVCKRLARQKRAEYQVQATLLFAGYRLMGQRFVRIKAQGHDFVMEVGELARTGPGVYTLSGNSVTPDDFAFDAASEEPPRPTFERLEDDGDALPSVVGLTGSAVNGGAIRFTWPAQDADLSQEMQLRAAGDEDWQRVDVPGDDPFVTVRGLHDGVQYEAQIRNITTRKQSPWSSSVSVRAVANATPPDALQTFAVTISGNDAQVTFTAPNDPLYWGTRIYRADDSTAFADAVVVHTEWGSPSAADTWTDASLSAGEYTYWAVPVNQSGQPANTGSLPATASGPVTLTIA